MVNMILPMLGAGQIILILAIVLLLFGARKIPELMRGMGRGVKEFKDAVKEDESEGEEFISPDAEIEKNKPAKPKQSAVGKAAAPKTASAPAAKKTPAKQAVPKSAAKPTAKKATTEKSTPKPSAQKAPAKTAASKSTSKPAAKKGTAAKK